ncbi:MAG TPA: RluA family pseudouridine synthase [Bryobacteraceae bacterium]|jgi:23S rRNA pseudouridine1911/1915/1917 synthase
MLIVTGPEDRGKRLDILLHERLPEFTRSRLQSWIKEGRARIDGKPARPSTTIPGAASIEFEPSVIPPLKAEPESIPLRILYEDADLAAIDKPAGMVVHTGAGVHSGTLVNALLHHFASLSQTGGDLRPGIVHRLDRFTSGVLLVAKTDPAHQFLARQFASREVEKTYLTLVHGAVHPDRARIDKPIARDPVHRARMTTRLATGRKAWSEYRVLQRSDRFSYLEVRIGTGRTHQIRVHLASLGHPVAGDHLYGAKLKSEAIPDPARYFLHSHRITFTRPSDQQRITIVSPLPADLEQWKRAAFA